MNSQVNPFKALAFAWASRDFGVLTAATTDMLASAAASVRCSIVPGLATISVAFPASLKKQTARVGT
eukprot:5548840-Amphidinium_carterae.1